VLSNAVVTNPLVPQRVRHSLNLESGLNDGLALPPVLALAAALDPTSHNFDAVTFILQNVGLGLAFGVAFGLLGSLLMPSPRHGDERRPGHDRSLYALGIAFAAYGVTVLPPQGNGLIAVYVCAIVLGARRHDLRDAFEERAVELVELLKLGVFVVFGSLLTLDALFEDGWAAVGIVAVTLLLARPVAVWVALVGTGYTRAEKAFMAWFGPKGIGTMTFSLLILERSVQAGERIFHLASLVVFASVLAHGLTDTPGTRWIARRTPSTS
jgi:NhaP-type Na+/H+ or K+/H+ antiporter